MLRKLTTVAALLVATSFLFAACGSDEEEAAPAATTTTAATVAPAEDVVVCELAYYTGEFGSYGAFLTASLSFAIDNVINTDPPLGRTWDLVSEDIGTVGEGQAALVYAGATLIGIGSRKDQVARTPLDEKAPAINLTALRCTAACLAEITARGDSD